MTNISKQLATAMPTWFPIVVSLLLTSAVTWSGGYLCRYAYVEHAWNGWLSR
jgi:hypothetical protein